MADGIVFNIEHFSIHDGPGIRTTVFLKGCPMKCIWCHNPEGLSLKVDEYSQVMTTKEVMSDVMRDVMFYDESGGGVTFSGGEPLMQPEFLMECLKIAREKRLHTAIETTGFTSREVLAKIIPYVDLFLYDMKPIEPQAHRKYTGVDNKIIKENLKVLAESGADIILRMVAIPGINDDGATIRQFIGFLKPLGISRLNLLPLHKTAEGKYRKLNQEFLIDDLEVPDEVKMKWWKEEYEKHGFIVKVGG